MKNDVGVIFDLDGVVVDTVGLLYKIYLNILERYNIVGDKEEFSDLNGPNLTEICDILISRHREIPDADLLFKEFYELHCDLYEKVDIIPFVEPLIIALKRKGVVLGLASSSSRKHVDYVLSKFNLTQYFEVIITGDDVECSKPNPEIYLKTSALLNTKSTYAIEDSQAGIDSAVDAGVCAVQLISDYADKNNRATHFVSTLREVSELFFLTCRVISQYEKPVIKIEKFSLKDFETEVNEFWDLNKLKDMLDAPSVVCKKIIGNQVALINTTYRVTYYILNNPNSRLANLLHPIGVSGYVVDPVNCTLVAKRTASVTQYKNFYEFPPSGGIEGYSCGADFQKQLVIELAEETGIGINDVYSIHYKALIEDRLSGQYDLLYRIKLKEKLSKVIKNNSEYENFQIIPSGNISDYCALNKVIPECILIAKWIEIEQ